MAGPERDPAGRPAGALRLWRALAEAVCQPGWDVTDAKLTEALLARADLAGLALPVPDDVSEITGPHPERRW